MGYYAGQAQVTLGIWKKVSGTWSRVATKVVPVAGGDDVATSSKSWSIDEEFQLGDDVDAVGVTVESVAGGSAGVVSDIQEVEWTAEAAGTGVRSATPNGEKAQITVLVQR